MFLVDDILFAPAKSLFWVFRKIHDAVQQEIDSEAENITAQLSDLYMMLETGQITEEEFDSQEKILLDRLDELGEEEDKNTENEHIEIKRYADIKGT